MSRNVDLENEDGFYDGVTPSTNAASESPVQQFYAGASVLVTGGTGFMGKVLIEKLLWTFPDLATIYVLVRDKKGQSGQQRIDALLASPCFDRLRRDRAAGFGCRLVAVHGDVTAEGLGISAADHDLLTRNVTVVFHVAATVRFNEPLHVAVLQNVRGTRELLQLCGKCPQLKAVVHVSTAYANCPRPDIEERFYAPPLDCDQAIEMTADDARALEAGQRDQEAQAAQAARLLGAWPNTYTFTKALAEGAVRKHGRGLPICVFRPAIVVSSFREPFPGWVDNMAGPGMALAGILTGFLRVLPGDERSLAAIVPCDMAINAMIVAAWDTARSRSNDEPAVYNFTPSASNTIKWQSYFSDYNHCLKKMPSNSAIWIPGYVNFNSTFMLSLARLVLQTVPSAIADAALVLAGRKPFASRLFGKINRALDEGHYFTQGKWDFEEKNVPTLWKKLGSKDRRLLDFDMAALDWDHYVKETSPGIRKFMLHEDPATIPVAQLRYRRMKLIRSIFRMSVYIIVLFGLVSSLLGFI